MKRIAFAGSDGRTLLWAYVVSTAKSEVFANDYQGVVVRGALAMPQYSQMLNWPVEFIPTQSNLTTDYAQAIIRAFEQGKIDYVVPMPESLLFDGLVDQVAQAGYGERILGVRKTGAFIEGDKIRCKHLCREAGVPVAPEWTSVNAHDYDKMLSVCLEYIDQYGGAVLKFPYSAGGKGARIILNTWEIRQVYDTLMTDYKNSYRHLFGKKKPWPLLIESRMSGVEISFTILVDRNGNYQILPTAMDYPERFEGPASITNPTTGGTGAISPHPMESPELMEMAGKTIAEPLISAMKKKGILRPCILYPGCFVSVTTDGRPKRIRACEINIRPGEPEVQPVARRLKNLGALISATLKGHLNEVYPDVRKNQLSACLALMTGPGGPVGQKGYPWSCTKGELVVIDHKYMSRKGIQVIPSAMDFVMKDDRFKSDGTRVAFLNANIAIKPHEELGQTADRLRNKLLAAFDNGKIRVIPREDASGNRLDIRRDVGLHFRIGQTIFGK